MASSKDAALHQSDVKWTRKNVEGETGRQWASTQKQGEDRNSSADRTVGTNRKSLLPGRRSHLTPARKEHSKGLPSGPLETELHSMCKAGEDKGEEKRLVKVRPADCGDRGQGPPGQQKSAVHIKIQLRKTAFYSASILKNSFHHGAKLADESFSCLKSAHLFS